MQWWWFNAFLGFILLTTAGVYCRFTHGNCYKARNCISSGKEECGINKRGVLKRFPSSCDMMKYNCDNYENYKVTYKSSCKYLKPPEMLSTKPTTTLNPLLESKKEWWCWEAAHCDVTNNFICGRDSRKVHRIFQSVCSMAKHNCKFGRDYEKVDVSIRSCLKLIKCKLSAKIRELAKMEKLIKLQPTHASSTANDTIEESICAVVEEEKSSTEGNSDEEDATTDGQNTITEEDSSDEDTS